GLVGSAGTTESRLSSPGTDRRIRPFFTLAIQRDGRGARPSTNKQIYFTTSAVFSAPFFTSFPTTLVLVFTPFPVSLAAVSVALPVLSATFSVPLPVSLVTVSVAL